MHLWMMATSRPSRPFSILTRASTIRTRSPERGILQNRSEPCAPSSTVPSCLAYLRTRFGIDDATDLPDTRRHHRVNSITDHELIGDKVLTKNTSNMSRHTSHSGGHINAEYARILS
jgi:hypothetical protein